MKPDEEGLNTSKPITTNKKISKLFKRLLAENYSRIHECFGEIFKRHQHIDEDSN